MYDPTIGRWLTRDPIGFAGGDPNLYRYLHNGPTNAVDPSGLQPSPTGNPFDAYRQFLQGLQNSIRNVDDTLREIAAALPPVQTGEFSIAQSFRANASITFQGVTRVTIRRTSTLASGDIVADIEIVGGPRKNPSVNISTRVSSLDLNELCPQAGLSGIPLPQRIDAATDVRIGDGGVTFSLQTSAQFDFPNGITADISANVTNQMANGLMGPLSGGLQAGIGRTNGTNGATTRAGVGVTHAPNGETVIQLRGQRIAGRSFSSLIESGLRIDAEGAIILNEQQLQAAPAMQLLVGIRLTF